MKLRPKFFLLLFALMAASVLVLAAACGGDGDEETPATGDGSPPAGETAAPPGETEEPSGDGGNGGGEAPDIPDLPGANKTFSGTYTGEDAPLGGLFGDSPLDPGEYAEVQYAVFETDDSVESVTNFYKDYFSDWKEEWTFGGDTDGEAYQMVVWSRADGKVGAWMTAVDVDGTTTVTVVTGAQ